MSDKYVPWSAPTQSHSATEDEPWDFSEFHGNLGPNSGVFYGVVEYDFAFVPDRPLSDATAPDSLRGSDTEFPPS